MSSRPLAALAAAGLVGILTAAPARADDQPPPAAPASWADGIKFSGHIDAGITFNPDDPQNGINFGHLFTDRANTPLLNQFMLTLERDLDPSAFCRVHRSAMVRLACVAALENDADGEPEVVLQTGTRLRVSRRYRKALQDRMGM